MKRAWMRLHRTRPTMRSAGVGAALAAVGGLVVAAAVVLPSCSAAAPAPAPAQSLSPEVLDALHQGAVELVMASEETTVPLVGTPTLPLVEVELDGRVTARFLIDLGANVVIVRRDVFERAGAEVVVDRESTDIGRFASVRIGEAELRSVTVGIYEELDVDGVIGYNALRHSSFTIDYPGQRFTLHRRELPSPGEAKDVLAYTTPDRMPMIEATLGGTPIVLNLDTGAGEWMTVPPDLVAGLRWTSAPAPGREVSNEQTGKTRVLEGRAEGALVLGPLAISEPRVYVNPDADYPWLGSSAMQGAVWTFDPRSQRVRIEIAEIAERDE